MRTPVKPIDPKDHLRRMECYRVSIAATERELHLMGEAECATLCAKVMSGIDRRIAIIKPEAQKPLAWSEAK